MSILSSIKHNENSNKQNVAEKPLEHSQNTHHSITKSDPKSKLQLAKMWPRLMYDFAEK